MVEGEDIDHSHEAFRKWKWEMCRHLEDKHLISEKSEVMAVEFKKYMNS